MDAHAFDTVTKRLTTASTRRTALRLLGGGLLSGLLAQRGARSTRAAQPGVVEQVPGADVLVSCAELGLEDCAGTCCTSEETCIEGYCQAIVMQPGIDVPLTCHDAGMADCWGICADTLNDPNHCGLCYQACYPGDVCQQGWCIGHPCPEGLFHCIQNDQGPCYDLLSDPTNCGWCNNVCPSGSCQGGVCM